MTLDLHPSISRDGRARTRTYADLIGLAGWRRAPSPAQLTLDDVSVGVGTLRASCARRGVPRRGIEPHRRRDASVGWHLPCYFLVLLSHREGACRRNKRGVASDRQRIAESLVKWRCWRRVSDDRSRERPSGCSRGGGGGHNRPR